MRDLPIAIRVYILAVILGSAAPVAWSLSTYPLGLTHDTVVLMLAAAVFGARNVKIGHRINLCVCHPFVFAALVLEGVNAALLVAFVGLLAATLLRRRRMRLHQVAFNLGTGAVSASLSSWVFVALQPAAPAPGTLPLVVPVLVTSLVYFLLNSWMVSVVVGLDARIPIFRAWSENALWSAPSFLAGGSLGLLMASLITQSGALTVLLALPFCYLIYYSYQLYLDRLNEKKDRLALAEKLNAELEAKVRERTEELLQVNEQLQLSNRQLADASRLKSEFLANVSHELRTPLNAIIGFSELLQSEAYGELGREQQEFLADIHGSGANLLTLINDILDLSKIEAGKMTLRLEERDPRAILGEAVSMVRLLARNKGLALTWDAGPMPALQADCGRIRQVLWNLLANAIKFTPEGGRVHATAVAGEAHVEFAVEDSGIGIPSDQIEKIFDPFYQVDGSHARQHSGTGLGLALVRKFVELHGGRIGATSTVGQGSRFGFSIPLELTGQAAAAPAAAAEPDAEIAVAPDIVAMGGSR